MELNELDEDEKKINLGGFPPIFIINTHLKKKREFKNVAETIKKNIFTNLNILNVKNILKN